jgi:hypothetical protein
LNFIKKTNNNFIDKKQFLLRERDCGTTIKQYTEQPKYKRNIGEYEKAFFGRLKSHLAPDHQEEQGQDQVSENELDR